MSEPAAVLSNVRLAPDQDPVDLHFADGRIAGQRPGGWPVAAGVRKIDGRGYVAVPGFIDLHVHGALGFDFMDASEEAFRIIGEYHAAGGTTSRGPIRRQCRRR
jgi:N-acetylglucosamine-6-phosphate deacetylase